VAFATYLVLYFGNHALAQLVVVVENNYNKNNPTKNGRAMPTKTTAADLVGRTKRKRRSAFTLVAVFVRSVDIRSDAAEAVYPASAGRYVGGRAQSFLIRSACYSRKR